MCCVYLLQVLISGVHCPQALESLKNLERFAYSTQLTSCMLLCCSTVGAWLDTWLLPVVEHAETPKYYIR